MNTSICSRCNNNKAYFQEYDIISGTFDVSLCSDCLKEVNKEMIEKRIEENIDKIPSRYRYYEFPNKVDIFNNYFLYGPTGTGKTTIACGLMKEAIKECMQVMFVNYSDMCLSSFESKELIRSMREVTYLVIDDFLSFKSSEWVISLADNIIDHRYRNQKYTTITSNFSVRDIGANFDNRIASRIAESYKINKIDGKDRRLQK